jgi:hypothetical protein
MSSEIVDPYAVLGISKSASMDDLRRAYRRLSKAWHPDRHTSESDAQRDEAGRRFKLINAAYIAVGEALREKAVALAPFAVQADSRVEAIRSVVASAALRLIPNLPRNTYRRVVGVAEALLLDAVAMGDRAFTPGFDIALREAMDFAGLSHSSSPDAIRVLDAAADELQWKGKGADPATWQILLQPLEKAMHPTLAPSTNGRPGSRPVQRNPAKRPASVEHSASVLRPEPALRAGQFTLAVLFILLLVPEVPLLGWLRVVLLLGTIVAAGYLTFFAESGSGVG